VWLWGQGYRLRPPYPGSVPMVIGETFAYGHIPKTGGDAVHAWLAAVRGLAVDSPGDPGKHDFFWERGLYRPVYALSIRRLPFWALSYLHELAYHPAAARRYGIPPDDPVRPEHALRLAPDEYLRQHRAGGREVAVWLRMENLFDDVVRFIDRHVRPVTADLRRRLAAVPTKGRRNYDHDVDSFFTRRQIAALYEQSPAWAAVERRVYGGLSRPVGRARRLAV
jgi:hypothetical protein